MGYIIGFIVGAFCLWTIYRGYKILKARNAFDFEDPEEFIEENLDEESDPV